MKKVCANCAYSEPGKPKAKDPGDGNLQPIVFRGHVAPIVAALYWGLSQGGKWLRVLLDNPAPLCSPFLPLAAELSLQIGFLLADPRDLGESAGKGLSSLDSGDKEVAEKGYVWMDSDKVFAQMCEKCHS